MPHFDADSATAHVSLQYPTAPFLPEMPLAGDPPLQARLWGANHIRALESTQVLLTLDFAGVTQWLESADSSHLFPSLESRARNLPTNCVLAFHMPGPLTVLGSATGLEGIRLWDVLPLRPLCARAIGRIAEQVVGRLQSMGHSPLVVLDEPLACSLDAANPANLYLLEEAFGPARRLAARVGVHWCCPPPLDVLLNVDLDYASIDLVRFGDLVRTRRRTLERWLARDRVLVLGVIDAADPASDALARERIAALCLPRESAILVAPTCGTSTFPLAREVEIARKLNDLATSLKESS